MPRSFSCDDCGFSGTIDALAAHDCGENVEALNAPTPDIMGEVIGYRAWKIVRVGVGNLRLQSVTHSSDAVWKPQDWTFAECRGDGHCAKSNDGRIPGEHCSCGIYAALDRKHLIKMGYNRYTDGHDVVIGQVGLVGKVVQGTQGYRATKARIVKVSVPYERWKLMAPLTEAYGPYGTDFVLGNNFKSEED